LRTKKTPIVQGPKNYRNRYKSFGGDNIFGSTFLEVNIIIKLVPKLVNSQELV